MGWAIVIIVGVILLVVLGIGLWVMGAYNRLVNLKERVRAGWSQIEVLLKRRHDLIPNLVESVRGYAAHESGTLESVIAARNQVKSSRIAHGVPIGGELEYVDGGTLAHALAGRRTLT